MTDRREDLRAFFDVENPKEVGRDPSPRFGATTSRWNAIPSERPGPATTSAPDRLGTSAHPPGRAPRNEGCPYGSPTDGSRRVPTLQTRRAGSSDRFREELIEDDTLAKCLHFGPTPRGVRQRRSPKEDRTRREGSPVHPRGWRRGDPPRCRSGHGDMAQRRDCDRPLRHQLAGAGRSGDRCSHLVPGRLPRFTGAANAKARITARSESRRRKPHGTDAACNGMQAAGGGWRRAPSESTSPQGLAEGDLEGGQGPGRTGRFAPSKVHGGTDLSAEQGLEGQSPADTIVEHIPGNGGAGTVADRRWSRSPRRQRAR